MARRRVIEQTVSHERWLVSYADFITLLFAFFVVMYSISQVNEGKYKVLSETLTEVFTTQDPGNPERTLDPFQVGEVAKSNPQNFIELEASAILQQTGDSTGEGEGEKEEQGGLPEELKQLNQQLDEVFNDLQDQQKINVRGNEEWLEIELKSSLLFESGDSRLSNSAVELLGDIADVVRDQPNPIRVEGFTDDRPIRSSLFPSNWELSSSRAAAVVKLFIEEGVAPSRLAAIGYGEHQPLTTNDTAEGRADNRRVVLMIAKTGQLRPELREITDAQAFVEQQPVFESEGNTGIEILIPGVEPDTTDAISDVGEETLPEAAQPGAGVRTIELEGGGLLFTNDAPPEANE